MEPQTVEKAYEIGGARYRLEPLSWQQNKWLAEHIFKEIDLERLDFATMWDLFREQGPLIMAISLIPEGETRAEHSRQAFDAISLRADEFAAELTGGEVATFAPHFFACCRPEQLAMLMPGKTLVQQMARAASEAARSAAPGETMSSGASSPSAAAMSPSSMPSSPDGGRLILTPISGAASSEKPSTAPSSDGSGSSSPG